MKLPKRISGAMATSVLPNEPQGASSSIHHDLIFTKTNSLFQASSSLDFPALHIANLFS